MTPLDLSDPFTEAQTRARLALRSDAWSSVKTASGTCGAVVFGVAAVVALLLGSGSIDQTMVAWIMGSAFLASGPFVYFVLEARRIYEQALALRELIAAQRDLESLVRDARNERDGLQQQVARLTVENETMRAMTIVAIGSKRREPEQ